MLKKPLAIAAIATAAALAPTQSSAGDAGLGALIGATLGAAIGHHVDGRHGAVVGGVIGAVTGANIAADRHDHYGPAPVYLAPPRVHYRPAPVYYAPPRVHYRPAPVYYAQPPVVVRTRPAHVHGQRPVYAPVASSRRHDGHGHDHRFTQDRNWR